MPIPMEERSSGHRHSSRVQLGRRQWRAVGHQCAPLRSRWKCARQFPVAAALLLLATPATAQPREPNEEEAIEVVVHAPRQRQDDLQDGTRPANVTSGEQVREAGGVQSVADAVRNQPGTSVQQTTPGQGTIYVRGLSGRAVIHVVDGVRVNSALFRAGNNPYTSLVDPYSLERIAVVGGASSVMFGSDGLTGAVLMRTALPGYRLGDDLRRLRAFQSVTTNPLGTASRLELEAASSEWALATGYTFFQAGPIMPGEGKRTPDPRAYSGIERDADAEYTPATSSRQLGTEFSFHGANLSARRKLARGLELVLRTQVGYRPVLNRYDQITPRFKREVPRRAESSVQDMYRLMTSATLAYRPRGAIYDELQTQLSYQRLHERPVTRGFDEVCVVDGAVVETDDCTGRFRLTPQAERRIERNTSDAVAARAVARFGKETASMLLAGADAHHDRIGSSAREHDLWQDTTVEVPARFPDGSSLTQLGAFASATQALASTLTLHGGVRGSLFALDIAARQGATAEESSPAEQQSLTDVTGAAGIRWEATEGVAWLANAGRGVRSPNVQDLSTLGPRAKAGYQVPNPDLEPEHSWTAESGFDVRTGVLSVRNLLFFVRYAGAIVLAPTTVQGETEAPDGSPYVHSENASSIDIYGTEGSFDLVLVRGVSLWGRWLAMLGTQHNETETGLPAETPADRIPPHQGDLGVSFEPSAKLKLSAFATGRAAQTRLNDPINIGDNRIPEGGTPGYVTFHSRVRYQASPATLVYLAVDNLTNRLVLEHGSGFYLPGFSATLGAGMTLE